MEVSNHMPIPITNKRSVLSIPQPPVTFNIKLGRAS